MKNNFEFTAGTKFQLSSNEELSFEYDQEENLTEYQEENLTQRSVIIHKPIDLGEKFVKGLQDTRNCIQIQDEENSDQYGVDSELDSEPTEDNRQPVAESLVKGL